MICDIGALIYALTSCKFLSSQMRHLHLSLCYFFFLLLDLALTKVFSNYLVSLITNKSFSPLEKFDPFSCLALYLLTLQLRVVLNKTSGLRSLGNGFGTLISFTLLFQSSHSRSKLFPIRFKGAG